jgi:hypothetical protein
MYKIFILLFGLLMAYSVDAISCEESHWFWKKDIREKKQFIEDFINHSDSISEAMFYEKYETFRIRTGFIEDYQEMFNDEYYQTYFFPNMQGFKWYSRFGKGWGYIGENQVLFHTLEISCFYKNQEKTIKNPKIQFRWVCKDEEWVLFEVRFITFPGYSFGIGTPQDYDNW